MGYSLWADISDFLSTLPWAQRFITATEKQWYRGNLNDAGGLHLLSTDNTAVRRINTDIYHCRKYFHTNPFVIKTHCNTEMHPRRIFQCAMSKLKARWSSVWDRGCTFVFNFGPFFLGQNVCNKTPHCGLCLLVCFLVEIPWLGNLASFRFGSGFLQTVDYDGGPIFTDFQTCDLWLATYRCSLSIPN